MLQDTAFVELPLGEGDVAFPAYLKALQEVGYHGYLTIEREVGKNPKRDIATAAEYLKMAELQNNNSFKDSEWLHFC